MKPHANPHTRASVQPLPSLKSKRWPTLIVIMTMLGWANLGLPGLKFAQGAGPALVPPNLAVRTVASGLDTPISMAFLGADELLVLEKNSGQVKHLVNGTVQGVALDLAVNFASERGLLGIALHPEFPGNPSVYLFWTESESGMDSDVLADVPLLGNRVDRFVWDALTATLHFDQNLIQLRAFQADDTNRREDGTIQERGNHDGGVLKFGPDGKLYIYMGDNGRRGQLQNLPDGPGCVEHPCPEIPQGNLPDDQFGGPEPDDAHLTGVILRLNDDGSTPTDNPFFRAGELRGGEAGENLQKVFAYGIRNGFGMAFDPFSGKLWEAQNGDDSFSELNIVEPGANLGWIQVMGPISRLDQFKAIETSTATDPLLGNEYFGLQQTRWPPTLIADSPAEALARLFMVFEGGDQFGASLTGSQEVPPVSTSASAVAQFELNPDGTLQYELRATGPIDNALAAHIHLGARGQNGPVAVFLFGPSAGADFQAGDLIAAGTLSDANLMAPGTFVPTIANLAERMRQGRAYVNLHTSANPPGEIRGQIVITDRAPVSRYVDPVFSWRFEVAPAAVAFVESRALGPQYEGDLIIGAARTFLADGHLFRFNITGNRRNVGVDDPRLNDRVADNLHKFDLTESESLLFGTGFGIATDIQTGPNGNLFVVSLSNGEIYEIFRTRGGGRGRGRP